MKKLIPLNDLLISNQVFPGHFNLKLRVVSGLSFIPIKFLLKLYTYKKYLGITT